MSNPAGEVNPDDEVRDLLSHRSDEGSLNQLGVGLGSLRTDESGPGLGGFGAAVRGAGEGAVWVSVALKLEELVQEHVEETQLRRGAKASQRGCFLRLLLPASRESKVSRRCMRERASPRRLESCCGGCRDAQRHVPAPHA